MKRSTSFLLTLPLALVARAAWALAPVAAPDSAATDEDVSVMIDVRANDTDLEGDPLTVVAVTTPGKGVAVIEDGLVRYTPSADATGGDSFSYTVRDTQNGESTSTVSVSIAAINDAPGPAEAAAGGEEATVRDPSLTVEPAADPDDAANSLEYQFRVYSDSSLANEIAIATVTAGNDGRATVTFDDVTDDAGANDDDAANARDLDLADDTTYYWRARANDGELDGPFGAARALFYNPVNDVPGAPSVVSPLPGSLASEASPVLSLGNATDVDDAELIYVFEVFVGQGAAGVPIAVSPAIAQDASGTTSWTVDAQLAEDGIYTWRATAVDPDGASAAGPATTFRISTSNAAPGVPALVSPAAAAVVPTSSVTLEIANSTDPENEAIGYWFEIDSDESFGSIWMQRSPLVPAGSSTTAWTTAELREDVTYHWRVFAIDARGASSAWNTSTFRVSTRNDGPAIAAAIDPVDARIADQTPNLIVGPAVDPEGDALTYDFEVRDTFTDGPVWADAFGVEGDAEGASFVVDRELVKGRTFYWRARGVDAHGVAGEWSAPARIEVAGGNGGGGGCSASAGAGRSASPVGLMAALGLALVAARTRRRAVG